MQEYFSIHSLPFPRVFVAIPSHCLNIPPKAPRAVPRCSKCGRHQHTWFLTPTFPFSDSTPTLPVYQMSIYLSIYQSIDRSIDLSIYLSLSIYIYTHTVYHTIHIKICLCLLMLGHLDLTLSKITLENQHSHCSTLPPGKDQWNQRLRRISTGIIGHGVKSTRHTIEIPWLITMAMSSLVGDAGCQMRVACPGDS